MKTLSPKVVANGLSTVRSSRGGRFVGAQSPTIGSQARVEGLTNVGLSPQAEESSVT